jgi:hypothetical protein
MLSTVVRIRSSPPPVPLYTECRAIHLKNPNFVGVDSPDFPLERKLLEQAAMVHDINFLSAAHHSIPFFHIDQSSILLADWRHAIDSSKRFCDKLPFGISTRCTLHLSQTSGLLLLEFANLPLLLGHQPPKTSSAALRKSSTRP